MIFGIAKLYLFKTVLRLTVMYASELWIMTKQIKDKLEIWERDATKNFGGSKDGKWRMETQMRVIFRIPAIIACLKAQKVRRFGHVYQISEYRHAKKVLVEGCVRSVKKKEKGHQKKRICRCCDRCE